MSDSDANATEAESGDAAPRWVVVESDTDATLLDAVHTETGTYAVGKHGIVIARESATAANGSESASGDHWERLLTAGPGVKDRAFTGVAATDDGKRLWYCGESGGLGYYDFDDRCKTNLSAPNDVTNNFTAIAVGGQRGGESVVVADGSGQVMWFEVTDDEVETTGPTKPESSGAGIRALAVTDVTTDPDERESNQWLLYAVNNSGNGLYSEGGEWSRVRLGAAACNDLTIHDGTAYVVTEKGAGYTVSPDCAPSQFSPGGSPEAIVFDGDRPVVAGPDGRIARKSPEGWTDESTGTDVTLHGFAFGEVDVAVGENGVVLERRPDAAMG